ncbi:MAG: signal peptidase I, partial [Lachnospiraceae bacterium]|nr:signal peptidase I [Lachnospiraceae bacterium]
GLPGETVKIDKDGVIYINDKILHESYGREIIENPGNALNGVTLGENEYYVLGDNRNDSEDSRFSIGIVKRQEIIGRAVFRMWPFAEIGPVK